MAKKITWTRKANAERKEILKYWIDRNQSKLYSIKLNKLITDTIKRIAEQPEACRKTEVENVRVKLVRDYLIFFEVIKNEVIILTIRDGRRDETNLQIK